MIGSFKDEPAFEEVIALGCAFRESEPYPDDLPPCRLLMVE